MVDANKAVSLVITLVVAGLMIAFLFPIVINAMGGAAELTVTQEVGDSTELQPNLTATLDSVDDTAGSATYTINASGDTVSESVDEDSNTTVTVDGTDVTIHPETVTTTNATTTYSYSDTYGWGGGAAALWNILRVIMILAAFLFLVYLATEQF